MKNMIYSFSHQIQSTRLDAHENCATCDTPRAASKFRLCMAGCFSKVTELHPAQSLSRLILASATLVAMATALAICWAAGAFDGTLARAGWVAIAIVLGLGWLCGGMLVSFLFLGARIERNATLAQAVAARHQTSPRRGGPPPQSSG